MTDSAAKPTLPLAGLKVLELANILAGPLIGQFCAELGADVIKVEQPGSGDPTRGWYLSSEDRSDDVSGYFSCANWGKRSIAIDIASPEGQALVQQLVKRSDIVIIGYKPGDDAKFGLAWEDLSALNSGLIYLQISAYGAQDNRPGFDAIIQAESGFTLINGEPDSGGVKMPVALVDLLAAHQLKEGLLLALLERNRTGQGAYVATSLMASASASLANQASNYLYAGAIPRAMGSQHPNIVPYGNILTCADQRQLVIAVGTERQWQGFAAALNRTEWCADPRFTSNAARVQNRAALVALIVALTKQMNSADLAESLARAKVPFGFVNDMAQVFAEPAAKDQLLASGRGVRTIALSGSLNTRGDLTPPPHLDEHRSEILAELESPG
ncbi:MAG: CoA transferase [Proteobacteria bacterium]|nr:CoA transferase [Pseudomonadota bacterium]